MLSLFRGARPLRRAGAIRDVLAGIVLAATDIPQVLGYTKIAGMPVVTGLYTLLLPVLAFAAFGSSRYLVVAADSATAAIFADGVSGMAPSMSPPYIALAGIVAMLTAGFLLVARLLRLGFIADFLSQTVLVGFLTGVGLQVGISVLSQMTGVPVHSRRPLVELAEVLRGLPRAHLSTIALSVAVLSFVLLLRRFAPKIPGALLVVVGAIAASEMWDFAGHGIATIGPVAGGLPHLSLPMVSWKVIQPLVMASASCAVMIITQSAATARIYATKHHEVTDENNDLFGLAAANAAAGMSGTFVSNGSLTQTAMLDDAGGTSQVAHVTTAAVVALVLLFLTRPLQYLPQCVLGVLVFLVALRLLKVGEMRAIRAESPQEFGLAVLTASVVVLVGVEQGIVLAMVLSLLRVVHHSYHPHSGVLVADGSGMWNLIPAAPGAVTEPGLVVYRFGAELFYANAARFSEEILCVVGPMPSKVLWVVVDAQAMTHVDYSAARVVLELKKNLTEAGVQMGFVRMPWDMRADFARHHLTDAIGPQWIFNHLHDARAAYKKLAEAEYRG